MLKSSALFGLLLLLVSGLYGQTQYAIGDTVESFTLKDYNNRSFRLSSYKGKIVVLNFFATW